MTNDNERQRWQRLGKYSLIYEISGKSRETVCHEMAELGLKNTDSGFTKYLCWLFNVDVGKTSKGHLFCIMETRDLCKILRKTNDCAECGSKDLLTVHHKDKDRTNNNFDNLVVLCWHCHAKHHPHMRKIPKWLSSLLIANQSS